MQINKYRNFSNQGDHQSFATIRLSPAVVNRLGGRNTWVLIKSKSREICRQIQGIGNQEIQCQNSGENISCKQWFTSDAVELDYDSWLELNTKKGKDRMDGNFYECDLELKKADLSDIFSAHWQHPNLGYRTPFRISIASLLLGFIGLLLGIISLF